ncbi:M23 family metallopeptidase [Micromonospora cathayae]|uniref:M23 family metallopeptidase n=1 Tax=Micromonospora cathayae TaxID=3028804 RepID=A0ABY7ZPT8_9ACTN|nr:M23 family metallopeptidase [Micromonospora sp. HUAS 3]WDZ84915.1 M23 family metallopeptidase [Micromonospora sp. HUAS 3]
MRSRLASLLSVGAVLVAAVLVPAAPAAAAPSFRVPFPCNQNWSGETRTGHSPQYAIDFNRADDHGDPVKASAPGTVDVVANLGDTSYGRYVRINHGGGYTTYYAHLSGFNVSVGDSVGYGTTIGYVGNSGGSSGSHLHYEQRLNGSDIKVRFSGNLALYFGTQNYVRTAGC